MTAEALILFSYNYNGNAQFTSINGVLAELLNRLESQNIPYLGKKRLHSIAVETLYNVSSHGLLNSEKTDVDFEVRGDGKNFNIKSVNYVNKLEHDILSYLVKEVNKLSKEKLVEKKKYIIKNGSISEKGTAGIGLVEIRLKSGNAINFNSTKIADDFYKVELGISFPYNPEN